VLAAQDGDPRISAGSASGRPAVLVAADAPGELSALPRLVELEQEFAELGEAFRAELLRPGGLDFADGFADDADRGRAAWGEGDPLGA
jgi:hypothetical protein